MKTISIPTYRRPSLLGLVLDALCELPGIKDWTLVFSLEPIEDEASRAVHKIVNDIPYPPPFVSVNHVRRGVRMNTFLALHTAFLIGSEFNIYLEEDYIMSADFLDLAEAFRMSDHSSKDLMLAFRRVNEDRALPAIVRTTGAGDGLMGCGFCCKPHALPVLQNWWFHDDKTKVREEGWDWAVGAMIVREGYTIWRPMVNRTRHIGQEGENTRLASYDNPGLMGPIYPGRITEFTFER